MTLPMKTSGWLSATIKASLQGYLLSTPLLLQALIHPQV